MDVSVVVYHIHNKHSHSHSSAIVKASRRQHQGIKASRHQETQDYSPSAPSAPSAPLQSPLSQSSRSYAHPAFYPGPGQKHLLFPHLSDLSPDADIHISRSSFSPSRSPVGFPYPQQNLHCARHVHSHDEAAENATSPVLSHTPGHDHDCALPHGMVIATDDGENSKTTGGRCISTRKKVLSAPTAVCRIRIEPAGVRHHHTASAID